MSNSRLILVDKAKLIAKIEENKANHIKEFGEGVVAYKKEALKQLKNNIKRISQDENVSDLSADINLTPPQDKTEDYDKLIMQFQWEEEPKVQLSQGEFNQYVHDETPWAVQAKFANSLYSGR